MKRPWSPVVAITAAATAAATFLISVAEPAAAANPIITSVYTADPAPLVVGNTMYIYAGRDEAGPGATNFLMREWRVLSSTDAANWTDHGARANIATFPWAGADAWASEVEPRNGRYYWYTSVNGNGPGWMNIGVAVGDSPLGPFTDAKGGPLISDSTPNSSPLNIDPTVFVDDDGQAYMYWGSFWGVRAVRLANDMINTVGSVVTPQGLTNFWEAPFMFKRNGLYYMIYAANDTQGCVTSSSYACQRYATATNPMGPWTHRGVVLGQVSSTTNHAGAVEFNGEWYLVYHNADAPGGGNYRRSVAVDQMFFNPDGTIQPVVQTTTGPPPNPGGGGGPPTGVNLGPAATASTSYVSPWESLSAVNNGGVPVNSQDRSNLAYGNWPEQGSQWVQYVWPSAVSVNRVATYWFDDNQGIDLPVSCQVQYWNGSSYVGVPGQSACGVLANAYNETTFTTVSTTRLRLNFTSRPGFSTGILEFMAFQAPGGGGGPPTGVNLGPAATASTSYVSPWESLSAVNNGGVPVNSQDRSNLAYGNWPEQGSQWVQYVWPSAVSVNRVATYWFDDNQGIDLPVSCQVQYWNGSSYVGVPGQSACGVLANAYNETTFTTVSTTRLRLNFTSRPGFSTGILEFMAFQA